MFAITETSTGTQGVSLSGRKYEYSLQDGNVLLCGKADLGSDLVNVLLWPVLRPLPGMHIPDIEAPENTISEVRIGGGSVIGFKNPSPFFDLLPPVRNHLTTLLAMGSQAAGKTKRHRKNSYDS